MPITGVPQFVAVHDVGDKKLHIGIKTEADQVLAYSWGLPIKIRNSGLGRRKSVISLFLDSLEYKVAKKSLQRHLEERKVIIGSGEPSGKTCFYAELFQDFNFEACSSLTSRLLVDTLSSKQHEKATKRFRKVLLLKREGQAIRCIQEGADTTTPFRLDFGAPYYAAEKGSSYGLKKSVFKPEGIHFFGAPITLAAAYRMDRLTRELGGLHGYSPRELAVYQTCYGIPPWKPGYSEKHWYRHKIKKKTFTFKNHNQTSESPEAESATPPQASVLDWWERPAPNPLWTEEKDFWDIQDGQDN